MKKNETTSTEVRQIGSPVAAFPGTRAVYWERDGSLAFEAVLVWVAVESRDVTRRDSDGATTFGEWGDQDVSGLTWSDLALGRAELSSNFIGYLAPGEPLDNFLRWARERSAAELAEFERANALQPRWNDFTNLDGSPLAEP